MAAVDRLNLFYGRATAGFEHGWKMRQAHKSPCYTTRLAGVPVVRP